MDVRRVAAGDVELAVAEAGVGGRPLLLVHGFGGAKEDFTDHLDRFGGAGWHAVAPDLRGHGDSEWPAGEDAYGFEVFAGDLLALADALGWRSFALLGHSMGGMVAQGLVLDHPERVDALVLMDTTHGPLDWLDADLIDMGVAVLREQGVAAYAQLEREMTPLGTPAFERLCRERPGYREFCDRKALATAAEMRTAMMPRFLSQPDRLERLRSWHKPTLVIVGEEDAGFVEHAERLAKTIPGARHVVVAGAGHSPQFEAPDSWWAAVSSFLEEV
jgi:pimeloyl-ACP methyl ester carboxylesterase